MALLLRFAFDIVAIVLAWRWLRRVKPKRRRRRIQARATVWALVAISLVYVIPTIIGPIFPPARHFREFVEGQKLRLIYMPVAPLPFMTASREDIDREVRTTARRHGLDPALVHAVIQQESGYKQFVISKAGACGLMQLQPSTFYSVYAGNPFAYRSNIRAGCKYLAQLKGRFNGDMVTALAAYNCGPGAVTRYGASAAGHAYARSVLRLAARRRAADGFAGME